MEDCSLIIYSFLLDDYYECLYVPNDGKDYTEEIQKIFNRAKAKWQNGTVVCCIEGDFRRMEVEEISAKCCENIREGLKW